MLKLASKPQKLHTHTTPYFTLEGILVLGAGVWLTRFLGEKRRERRERERERKREKGESCTELTASVGKCDFCVQKIGPKCIVRGRSNLRLRM